MVRFYISSIPPLAASQNDLLIGIYDTFEAAEEAAFLGESLRKAKNDSTSPFRTRRLLSDRYRVVVGEVRIVFRWRVASRSLAPIQAVRYSMERRVGSSIQELRKNNHTPVSCLRPQETATSLFATKKSKQASISLDWHSVLTNTYPQSDPRRAGRVGIGGRLGAVSIEPLGLLMVLFTRSQALWKVLDRAEDLIQN
jgi:hypothetical protein